MKSRATKDFWRLYRRLPRDVREQADAAFELFEMNPRQRGLAFKCVYRKRQLYSARIGLHYRTLAIKHEETLYWFWIGSHAEYDAILDQYE